MTRIKRDKRAGLTMSCRRSIIRFKRDNFLSKSQESIIEFGGFLYARRFPSEV